MLQFFFFFFFFFFSSSRFLVLSVAWKPFPLSSLCVFSACPVIYRAITPQTAIWGPCKYSLHPQTFLLLLLLFPSLRLPRVMWPLMDPTMPYVVRSTLAAAERSREDGGVRGKNVVSAFLRHVFPFAPSLPPPMPAGALQSHLLFLSLQEATWVAVFWLNAVFSTHPQRSRNKVCSLLKVTWHFVQPVAPVDRAGECHKNACVSLRCHPLVLCCGCCATFWLDVQNMAVTSGGSWSTCSRTALLSHLEPVLLLCGGVLCSCAECAEKTCWCRWSKLNNKSKLNTNESCVIIDESWMF